MPQKLIPLIRKSVAGDREAFEQLLHSQKPNIFYIIRGMTDCPEDAKDIHQEVSVRVYQNIASLKSPEAFFAWLRTIVVRECLRHLASRKHFISIEALTESNPVLVETDTNCNPFAHMEKHELCSAIASALESLHEPLRDLLHMRYGRDMCCNDIAAATGMKSGTVSVSLFRAKQQLRKKLQSGFADA